MALVCSLAGLCWTVGKVLLGFKLLEEILSFGNSNVAGRWTANFMIGVNSDQVFRHSVGNIVVEKPSY